MTTCSGFQEEPCSSINTTRQLWALHQLEPHIWYLMVRCADGLVSQGQAPSSEASASQRAACQQEMTRCVAVSLWLEKESRSSNVAVYWAEAVLGSGDRTKAPISQVVFGTEYLSPWQDSNALL